MEDRKELNNSDVEYVLKKHLSGIEDRAREILQMMDENKYECAKINMRVLIAMMGK